MQVHPLKIQKIRKYHQSREEMVHIGGGFGIETWTMDSIWRREQKAFQEVGGHGRKGKEVRISTGMVGRGKDSHLSKALRRRETKIGWVEQMQQDELIPELVHIC